MKKPTKIRIPLVLALTITFLIYAGVTLAPLFSPKSLPKNKALRGIAWFDFGRKSALEGWEEKIFKGRTIYTVKTDKVEGYLAAYSKRAASGMLRWVKFNPVKTPMVAWKWKVIKFPDPNKAGHWEGNWWVEKDDYAARFYLIFPRFPFFRMQCIEYIWDKNLAEGTVITNPNFKNLKIIVVESGEDTPENWVSEERNVYADYKKLFGRNPGPVGAIAIMTDADNSASTAEAQYNDIEVGYAK